MLRGTLDHFFYFVKRLILHYWYDLLWNKIDNLYFLGNVLCSAFSLHNWFPWMLVVFLVSVKNKKQGRLLLPCFI